MRVGIIGLGVIGRALHKAASEKPEFDVRGYDKFILTHAGLKKFEGCVDTEIVFLCLPTLTYAGRQDQYAVTEVLSDLADFEYKGLIVIRSTVLPGTTERLSRTFPTLRLCHNPEFLTAARPYEDLLAQKAVLLGGKDVEVAARFWKTFSPDVSIFYAGSPETEMAKYMHNLYLVTKLSLFNDFFEVCEHQKIDYAVAVAAAASIGQLSLGHTKVPGPDAKRGWSGMCFPKDTQAFLSWAHKLGLNMETLNGAVESNNRRRPE